MNMLLGLLIGIAILGLILFVGVAVVALMQSRSWNPDYASMTLKGKWDRAVILLSTETRRNLALARSKVAGMDLHDDEKFVALSRLNMTSNKDLIRLFVAAESDKWLPDDITDVLETVQHGGGYATVTRLTDAHFGMKTEMRELRHDKAKSLGSFLSPDSITAYREGEQILRHAFRNTEDWELIVPLLRDRDMWNYSDVMETLAVMKSSGPTALTGGAL